MDLICLDICCLKRPFDDQSQDRIRREAAAVAALIEEGEAGRLKLVRPPALDLENAHNPREDPRLAAALWLDGAAVSVALTDSVEARARELGSRGFSTFDALHGAFAEAAGARWLAMCDDRLLDLARKHRQALAVEVASPIEIPAGRRP